MNQAGENVRHRLSGHGLGACVGIWILTSCPDPHAPCPRPLYHTRMQTYLVGGAVRDELLGLPVVERDWVVVGATPDELSAQGFTPVGRDFPVFLHPQTKEEHALART